MLAHYQILQAVYSVNTHEETIYFSCAKRWSRMTSLAVGLSSHGHVIFSHVKKIQRSYEKIVWITKCDGTNKRVMVE